MKNREKTVLKFGFVALVVLTAVLAATSCDTAVPPGPVAGVFLFVLQ